MEYAGIALIPLVIGLAEIVKNLGLNAKFIPIISLIFGLVAGIIFLNPSDIKAGIIQGIFIGLSASGLYSGVKNVREGL
jgi:hypothetical protein